MMMSEKTDINILISVLQTVVNTEGGLWVIIIYYC